MRVVVVIILAVSVAVTVSSKVSKSVPLENIDVENTLRNEKLVARYINCVLGKGRCDSNGRDLKEVLPRVLKQNCTGCTAKQRHNVNRIVNFMKRNHAKEWAAIHVKYSARV